MPEEDQAATIGQNAFRQLLDIFVLPELQRRQDAGALPKPLDLWAAQIIFFPDGRKPLVRINTDVKAMAVAMLKGARSIRDSARLSEVEKIERITLTDEDDPDCGHATMLRIKGNWVLTFDFRYNKALAKKHLDTAREFHETGKAALAGKHWAAFTDNLFSAAELAVKAELLSVPDAKFRRKTTHPAIHSRYNRFANLGNAKPEHRKVYNKLYALRSPARYVKTTVAFEKNEATRLLEIVGSMINDTSARMAIRILRGSGAVLPGTQV